MGIIICGPVDLGGIEPPPQQCECRVIPLYYRPTKIIDANVPDLYKNLTIFIYKSQSRYTEYKRGRVMPLYYRPGFQTLIILAVFLDFFTITSSPSFNSITSGWLSAYTIAGPRAILISISELSSKTI
jgi:hypothetical protein